MLPLDEAKIQKLHAKGKTVDEVVGIMGCSTSGVRKVARRLGFSFSDNSYTPSYFEETRAFAKEGLSNAEAAARAGISRSSMSARCRRAGVTLKSGCKRFEVDPEELKALVNKGLAQVHIAEHYGVSQNTISMHLRKYGLNCKRNATKRRAPSLGTKLPKELATKLLNEGMDAKQIAKAVDLSAEHVRTLLLNYKLVTAVQHHGGISPFNGHGNEGVAMGSTPAEDMQERILRQEFKVVAGGYLGSSRGLDKAGDVIIRARSACGVAVSFGIGSSVPKSCGPRCACQTGYRRKAM